MKKLLIILLFPILSYSQDIGDKFNFDGMKQIEYETFNMYVYESKDSTCKISVSKADNIISIDYVLSRELVAKKGLKWLPRQIGDNVYYNGDYYFVLPKKNHFLIQQRNVSKFL